MFDLDSIVELKDARQSQGDVEKFVCDTLFEHGPLKASELVKKIVEHMYREELMSETWIVEIGVMGPSVFESEAMNILKKMNNRCVQIKKENNK